MKTLITALALVVVANMHATAQSKADEKYSKASAEMRQQVWDSYKDEFVVKPIPAAYQQYSKVVLARHTELTADSKSKVKFTGLGIGVNKSLSIVEIAREMIKLNDKNAINYYSELSFTQFENSSGFYHDDKTTTYVGVRIIKPDGSMKEINADEMVLTRNETKLKKAKLAIPDLQPGDIIDYFIATEQQLSNDVSKKSYRILLFDDAPIMNMSFHSQLGKKYSVQYRSYNGAPDLQVSKNEDKDIIIDVKKENIPAFETNLWTAPAQQLPFIRMFIAMGYRGPGAGAMGANAPGEVEENKDATEVINLKGKDLSGKYYEGYWMKYAKAEYDAIENDAKAKAKKAGINFKELSNEEKSAYLFYTLRFTKLLNFDISRLSNTLAIGNYNFDGFAFVLFSTLKAAGLDPAIMLSTDRTGYRMEEVMEPDDFIMTAYLPDVKKYFSIRSVYDAPFTIPQDIEGLASTKNVTFRHPNAVMGMAMFKLAQLENGEKVPVSYAESNAHIDKLSLALTADKNSLAVIRSTTLKGFYKRHTQAELILYEDFYEAERQAFKQEKSLIEELEDGKKSKKFVDEVKSAFAEARKKQKDAFVDEAKEWFEQDVTDVKDYKIVNMGVRHTAPDFVYSSSFKLDGLVKKAGNNFVIEIGKIQGKPLVVKEEQRKRNIDVFMPYARTIAYDVELAIPEGYSAEGIVALNKTVKNECGSFVTTASATDKLVTIRIQKTYNHNFEPAKNWDNIIAFTDAANDWTNAKILMKKK